MDQDSGEGRWRPGIPVSLTFPVPMSQNAKTRILKGRGGRPHWTRLKNEAKDAAWFRACSQVRPPRKPLEHVRIVAHFRLHNLRDDDKLSASLEWILDALKGHYFVDDDPRHILLMCTQRICRTKSEQGVTLVLTPSP